jgi:NADPH:quinone reductase-like Zn-dependent oxidoreductase
MKAVRLYEFGGPDKLVYGEHPMPDVGPGDVLVKVLATSVSRWDIKYRSGEVHEFYGKATTPVESTAAAPFRCRCSSGVTSPAKSPRSEPA